MKTVQKTWGEERWITNSEKYCGKLLILNKGFRCSLHYHRDKDETFYIHSGKVLMEVGEKKVVAGPGEVFHIPPKALHRFSGIEDSLIVEFSTHHDDEDSYRLEESGPFEVKDG